MHLKAITIAGFKSFPDRTRLEFGEGVSVIVGPNGSGKSNITDAVLWALGEQSPLAVRGQSMQDVIFGGGRGVTARHEAEVELLLDNSDAKIDIGASELSISRRYNRAGEGEYRLNGTQCRLVDVLELLSDTGLGKEAHSVISQGRVEAIVTSRPRDRRLLIEEAAGLGKHRKRRRRAQLKLERTEENLDRALDVEREARARLRPLKRQAEAAELHERLERQSLEARWTLTRGELRARRARLVAAEETAAQARAARGELEAELSSVAQRREEAEHALAQRSERHDAISRRAFGLRSAQERIALRLERGRALIEDLEERARRRAAELGLLREAAAGEDESPSGRVAALEAELAVLAERRELELVGELEALESQRATAASAAAVCESEREERRLEAGLSETAVAQARAGLLTAEREIEAARREAASVGADLAAVNQFLRTHAAAGSGGGADLESARTVEPGYELALAATLGGRLAAAVVGDRAAGLGVLNAARDGDARALVAPASESPAPAGAPPTADARPLLDALRGEVAAMAVAARLLADTWVVEDLDAVADSFKGVAVTRGGRVWSGALGELRQVASGGRERALEQRNRREALVARAEQAASAEHSARVRLAEAQGQVQAALDAREAADGLLRAADRAHGDALEAERRAAWLIEQRRAAPEQGESAVRGAQLEGELAAERRALERADRERQARADRIAALEAQGARDGALAPATERFIAAGAALAAPLEALLAAIDEELRADSAAGEALSVALRECASAESALQGRLRELAETVTSAEVSAQQARDQAADAEAELGSLAGRLGLEALPAEQELGEDEREALPEPPRVPPRAARARQSARRRRIPRGARARRDPRGAAQRPRGGAPRTAHADRDHRPRDLRELRADLCRRGGKLRGACRRRLPRRPGTPSACQRGAAAPRAWWRAGRRRCWKCRWRGGRRGRGAGRGGRRRGLRPGRAARRRDRGNARRQVYEASVASVGW